MISLLYLVLERDGFEMNPPCFGCFVAELEEHEVEQSTEGKHNLVTVVKVLFYPLNYQMSNI